MPLTLAEAKVLTQDKLCQTVIDEFRKDPILDSLIFDDDVSGGGGGSSLSYVYNRVSTLPTAGTRAINSEYVPQETKTTPITVALKVLGGAYQLDRVIANHVKGVVSQVDFQTAQKIQATKAEFADLFINGDSANDATQFDGLDKAITGSSTEANTAADIDLNSSADIDSNFKAFMDAFDRWLATLARTPDQLLMNRTMHAVMQGVARRSNSFTTGVDAFGKPAVSYSGIKFISVGDKPGTANPIIPIAAGITSIYAVCYGLDGVHGITADGSSLVQVHLPDFKTAGAVKTGDVEMVAAVALKATRAAGAFRRILIG